MSSEHEIYIKKRRQRQRLITLTQILILIGIFGVWELCAQLKIIDPFIFSMPSRVLSALVLMAADGSLFLHIGVTLGETIVGFVLGTVLGVGAGIFLWWNNFWERVLSPYLVILNSLPKTALAPIIIVWIGNNVKSVIVTALLTSVIVTIITVLSGFLQVDSEKIKLIKTFGGTKRQILTKVILPSSIPSMISALKINVGLSFVGVIVGEFLVAQSGLGYLIVYGSQIFICIYKLIPSLFFWNCNRHFIKEIQVNVNPIRENHNFFGMSG